MTANDLFEKYDVPVPRYTSYPTVPAWHATPSIDQWTASLSSAIASASATLSIYVHLPFCETLCTFCGCNTVITRDHGRTRPYIDSVLHELDLYIARTPALRERPVRQIHLGGGTPTFCTPDELDHLLDGVFDRLSSDAHALEGSVEADPRVTTPAHLDVLRARGFTRLSLGVQDFNPDTQRLVNRVQSPALVSSLVSHARAAGFTSINFDLIYGLPGQTRASMEALVDQVLAMAPDRLAVYSFARVPWIKPQQRKFTDEQIPVGAEKRALYDAVRQPLLAGGYLELGLDHFALPHDSLARAAEAGALHRNFQGYTESHATILLGLGVSAISETADCYHQNEKVITLYDRRLRADDIPTLRGHALSDDDRRRRANILALMTRFAVTVDEADLPDAAAFLAPFLEDGLARLDGRELRIPPDGRPFVRNIAAFFDVHFRTTQRTAPVYSRAI